jgi:hypothetical protein
MKTLANPKDKEEIVHRLQAIHAASKRRWGKMSAHQMVCHLSDGYRMYMNEKIVAPEPQRIPPSLLKWIALWAPIPWPRGFKTAPELDQQIGGTTPAEFEADIRELLKLLDRLTHQPRDFQWQLHPHFGPLSDKEWMRLAYLHPDHHLRQFGA